MDIQYFALYMTPDQVQDCVIVIVTEVDMDNYTILQFINNHFTETFLYIYEINN